MSASEPVSASQEDGARARPTGRAVVAAAAVVVAPLLLLAVLRLRPSLDALWMNQQAHFWIVPSAPTRKRPLRVKGKREPVTAYLLRDVPTADVR